MTSIKLEGIVGGKLKVLVIALVAANLLIVIVVAAFVLFNPDGLSSVLGSFQASSPGQVYVQAPSVVEEGSEFELVVAVQNTGQGNLTVDEILLPQDLLDALVVTKVFPGTLNQTNYGASTGFAIDFILTPAEAREFRFTLQALKEIDFSGNVEVRAGSSRMVAGTRVVIASQAPPVAQATPTQTLAASSDVPYQAVVKITAMYLDNGQLKEGWSGSGSIVSSDGLILTNAHVVLPDKFFPVDALVVSLTPQPDQLPVDAYYAEVLQADWLLDVAVIRITTDMDKSGVDRSQLNLPTVPLGDSDQIQLGDSLLILGYPGIGGGTITLTRGEVSGFTGEHEYGDRAYIKTSATIAGGNSGGLVVDGQGHMIAIPTQLGSGSDVQYVDCRVIADTNRDGEVNSLDSCVPTGGFINALRPIKLAVPLIEAAQRGEYNIIEKPKPDIPFPVGRVVLYQDDFSNPDSGWTSDTLLDGFVGYRNGEYQIQVDIETYIFWGLAKEIFSDIVMTVKTRIITPVGDGEYGIICRHKDNANFYGMTLTEDGWFSIWKLEDDEFTQLLDWDYSRDIPQYEPATISAACIGNQLTLAVNGIVLGQVTDYTFSRGDIGLFAGTWEEKGFTIAFDNLIVMSP
jgi:S1-C subfamily serine protease